MIREHPGSDACSRISSEISRAVAEDRAEAIVLGCAGMVDLADALAAEHGLPVLDSVSCAVALAESMVKLRLRTSRLGGYSAPRQAGNRSRLDAVQSEEVGRCPQT